MFKSIAQDSSGSQFALAFTVLMLVLGVAFANMATPHIGDAAGNGMAEASHGAGLSAQHS